MTAKKLLSRLGVELDTIDGDGLTARSPIDGETLASLRCDSSETVAKKINLLEKEHFPKVIEEFILKPAPASKDPYS